MLRALDHRRARPRGMKQIVAAVFLLSLRTGMRVGEIRGMQWKNVHAEWVELPETKNGQSRHVPLPPKAVRLLQRLRGLDEDVCAPITAQSLDALFRKARKAAGLAGFTQHDARHTAATRIGRIVGQPGRLSFVEFVKIFGWRDPKFALVYVNPSAASLASKF